MSTVRELRSRKAAPVALTSVKLREQRDAKIVAMLQEGFLPREIARKLGEGNPRRTRRAFRRIQRLAATSKELQLALAEQTKGIFVLGGPEMAEAVVRRGKRGRIDAAKLAMEVSGVHNSKVSHEHSGEVKITIGTAVARPPRADQTKVGQLEEGVVDAEVVED